MDDVAASLARVPAREEGDEAGLRWAAVALVLTGTRARDAELLFIRRALRDGDPWSGHVAFPGGRRDPTDRDLLHTAVRETHEELGLDLVQRADARLLGALDDLRPRNTPLPPIVVRPVVFTVASPVALVPNVEVRSAFWTPLATLLDPAVRGDHVVTRGDLRVRFPAYRLGDDVVWGMTERIVTQFLLRLREGGALD
jgi:8-oxo-dGTP pyrophosphatase MutT (NUDIX family)